MSLTIARHRVLPIMAALLSVAITLAATWFVSNLEFEYLDQKERSDALERMSSVRILLEKALWSTVSSMQPIVSYVAEHGEIDSETFQGLAKQLIAGNSIFSTVLLVRETSIADVYPLSDNDRIVGADLPKIPELSQAIQRVIQSGEPLVTALPDLAQGGSATLSMTPVFLRPTGKGASRGQYWGQVGILIMEEQLLRKAGVYDHLSQFGFAFRSKNAGGTESSFVWGDEKIFKSDPIVMDVLAPGAVLEMATVPKVDGVLIISGTFWFLVIGGVGSVLIGWMVWSWLMTKEKFEQRLHIQRKLVEKAQSSEVKYKTVFESSTDAMLILREGKFVDCNTASLQMFCCARHQLLGNDLLMFSPPVQPDGEDSGKKIHRKIAAALTGNTQFFEWKHSTYDRMTFDAEISLVSLEVHGEQILYATIRDVTDRKRAENEIRTSISLLQSTLESTADGIVVISSAGRVSAFNQRFLDQWNIPQELINSGDGGRILEFVLEHVTNPKNLLLAVKESYSEPEIEIFDITELKDGRILERYSRPQRISNTVVGRVWNFRDVTEKRRAEQELRAARDELETRVKERTSKLILANEELEVKIAELNRTELALKRSYGNLEIALNEASMLRVKAEAASATKSEFLANMSHELRSPLTAVIGFSDLLEQQFFGELNGRQLQYVKNISDAGRHLLTLINEILDLAKVESGKIEIKFSSVDLDELLDRCSKMIREMAMKRGLNFYLKVSEDLKNKRIQADEVRLKQMVINLLSNSIKFTPAGGTVRLEAGIRDTDICISVSDTGIGLKPEDQERIFGAFEQVDSSYSRQEPGTGLGLALVRTLAKLHGGSVSVDSGGEGMGCEFTLMFPFMEEGSATLKESASGSLDVGPQVTPDVSIEDQQGIKILVVEDNENNMKVTTDMLESRGYIVLQAFSAEQAIRMLGTQIPNLILMDVSLPGMDGLSATKILKSTPEWSNIPVAAFTAHAMTDDQTRAMKAGCDAYILKPIDSAVFFRTVSELTTLRGSGLSDPDIKCRMKIRRNFDVLASGGKP